MRGDFGNLPRRVFVLHGEGLQNARRACRDSSSTRFSSQAFYDGVEGVAYKAGGSFEKRQFLLLAINAPNVFGGFPLVGRSGIVPHPVFHQDLLDGMGFVAVF